MKKYLVLILLVLTSLNFRAEKLSFEDVLNLGLPVVVINTDNNEEPSCEFVSAPEGSMGNSITNATKIPGNVTVISTDGEVIYESGPYEKNESGMTIKIRGNTSAYGDKKPYKIKLQKKGDLLGRGDKNFNDKNWVLLNNNGMKLWVGFELSRLIGEDWTPDGMYVNVIMNEDYRGLYYLCESVERNEKCRINVSESGFIVEHDAYWWNEDGQFIKSKFLPSFAFTFKYPDYEDLKEEDIEEMAEILNLYEEAVSSENGNYESVIDIDSFTKWILGHDILGSWDGGGSNLYLSKYDRSSSSKIKVGPLWDFDSMYMMSDQWSNLHNGFKRFNAFYSNIDSPFMTAFRNFWDEKGEEIFSGLNEMIEDLKDAEKWAPYDLSSVENVKRWEYSWRPSTALDASSKAEIWFNSRYIWLQAMFESYNNEDAGIGNINANLNYPVTVYSLSGMILNRNCTLDHLKSLPKGIYIIAIGNQRYKISI